MFNTDLVNVLKELNNFSDSVILRYPETVIVSESQDIMACLDIKAIDDDEFREIGIKNSLGDFLNLLKMFPEDRAVNISDTDIEISSGDMSSVFIHDNIALMSAEDKNSTQFSKTEEVPSVAEFALDVEDIKKIKNATGVFKDLTEVLVSGSDDKITVSLAATNRFNARSNSFSITKNISTAKEFSVKIPIDNFKMLPVSEYDFHVKYNSSKNAYRLYLKNKSIPLNIIMSVKV